MNNKAWSEKILQKLDPDFKHRWEVYNELVVKTLNKTDVWIDCGAGDNSIIESFGYLCKTAIGIDLVDPIHKKNYFFKLILISIKLLWF